MGQKQPWRIFPGALRPALIGVSSISSTRLSSTCCHCASWIGVSRSTARPAHAVSVDRLSTIPASVIRWCCRHSGRWWRNLSISIPASRLTSAVARSSTVGGISAVTRDPVSRRLTTWRTYRSTSWLAGCCARRCVTFSPTTTRSASGIASIAGSRTSMVVTGTEASKRSPCSLTDSPRALRRRWVISSDTTSGGADSSTPSDANRFACSDASTSRRFSEWRPNS